MLHICRDICYKKKIWKCFMFHNSLKNFIDHKLNHFDFIWKEISNKKKALTNIETIFIKHSLLFSNKNILTTGHNRLICCIKKGHPGWNSKQENKKTLCIPFFSQFLRINSIKSMTLYSNKIKRELDTLIYKTMEMPLYW